MDMSAQQSECRRLLPQPGREERYVIQMQRLGSVDGAYRAIQKWSSTVVGRSIARELIRSPADHHSVQLSRNSATYSAADADRLVPLERSFNIDKTSRDELISIVPRWILRHLWNHDDEFRLQQCRLTRTHPEALSSGIEVQYGPGVTVAEACALRYAEENLDRAIVRVPAFVQFFTSSANFWPVGYLVMTFIEGTTLDRVPFEDASIARNILQAIVHISSFTHSIPGPLDGSPARGLLWSEEGAGQHFASLKDLQEYVDVRLSRFGSQIDISDSTLHLCHMDIAPRNIIVDSEGVVCILDWGCAGFYPNSFELWAISFEAHVRGHPIVSRLESLSTVTATPVERLQVAALNEVFSANQRFNFPNPERQKLTESIITFFEQNPKHS
nr:hypothetical protein CFP56_62487 [Quercus suber]